MFNYYSKKFPYQPPRLPIKIEKPKADVQQYPMWIIVLIAYSIGATLYYTFLLIYFAFFSPQGTCERLVKTVHIDGNTSPIDNGNFGLLRDEEKCGDAEWIYSEKTNFCYYYQNFTNQTNVDKSRVFEWVKAESNCQLMGGHLLSIHSLDERDFVKDLIATHLRVLNLPNYDADMSGCGWKHLVWIGLELTDLKEGEFNEFNVRRWSDGTVDEHFFEPDKIEGDRTLYALCNDQPAVPNRPFLWKSKKQSLFTRYICKRPSKSSDQRVQKDGGRIGSHG